MYRFWWRGVAGDSWFFPKAGLASAVRRLPLLGDGFHCATKMLSHHVHRDIQLFGDLPLRHFMDAMQQKYLTLAHGQRLDDVQQRRQLLLEIQGLLTVPNIHTLVLRHESIHVRLTRTLCANPVDGTIERRPAQIRQRRRDMLLGGLLQHLNAQVMHQVTAKVPAVETTPDVLDQIIVMKSQSAHDRMV